MNMTVRELIEALEGMPQNYHIVADNAEITEIVIREEVYYNEEGVYSEGMIVKLY